MLAHVQFIDLRVEGPKVVDQANPEYPQRHQVENARAPLAQVKPVDSEDPQEREQNPRDRVIFRASDIAAVGSSSHGRNQKQVDDQVQNILHALLMGLLWFACITLYGAGASQLGKLGTTIGWLICMTVTVIMSNLWGMMTGDWEHAPIEAK